MDEDLKNLIDQADEILHEDIAEFHTLEAKANSSKQSPDILASAIKAKELADLYLEAIETINPRFDEYKEKAGNLYLKFYETSKLNQTLLMAILMYIQADRPKLANKQLQKIIKIQNSKKKRQEIDNIVFEICIDILNNHVQEAYDQLQSGAYNIDPEIAEEIELTFQILAKRQKAS